MEGIENVHDPFLFLFLTVPVPVLEVASERLVNSRTLPPQPSLCIACVSNLLEQESSPSS